MTFNKDCRFYFWVEDQIVSIENGTLHSEELNENSKFNGAQCVDTAFFNEANNEKYVTGTFTLRRRADGKMFWHWVYVSLADMNKEFKLQLMLLGITL